MTKPPIWFWAASAAGLLWNVYGLWQFAKSLTATPESLLASGMTAEQAAIMTSYPTWMTFAFAMGVMGGFVGSVLLLLRRGRALPVLTVSLAGYVVLYLGDVTQGVFVVMGTPQVIVLTVVVAIAVGLLMLAAMQKRHYFWRESRHFPDTVSKQEMKMQYMLLLTETAEDLAKRNDPVQAGAYWGGWNAFIGAMAQAGVIVNGDGLQGPHTATTLRVRDGARQVQDGPFADTKEQLAGYFVIEVADLDAALDWAAKAPSALSASVEVRPVLPPMAP